MRAPKHSADENHVTRSTTHLSQFNSPSAVQHSREINQTISSWLSQLKAHRSLGDKADIIFVRYPTAAPFR
jgi:hypothetical protein